MKRLAIVCLFALATFVLSAPAALAQCTVSGDIEAAMTTDPLLPAWEYTMTVTWDTGTMFGLSHFNLLVDLTSGTCDCQDVLDAITLVNPSGTGEGVDGDTGDPCSLDYNAYFECDGDPSIPGVDGIIIKWEPDESLGCEPGPTGTVDVVFYSDLSPVPVDEDVISMSDKAGLTYCFGSVTGVFPGLACDPVSNADATWGDLKGMYR